MGETAATTVSAKVLKGEEDITSEYAASAFVWTRDTGDAAADATWNAAHNGVKEFTVNASELSANVKFTCTLTGTSPDYGTVYVDENMNLIHAPAEADANDTLHLENCILSVETPNNEYHLDGNVLSVVRNRLNGSVTAEAWVYTAAPEKLVEFAYNSAGQCVRKTVERSQHFETFCYAFHGRMLTHMTVISSGLNEAVRKDELHFFYDAQNRPARVEMNGTPYAYLHNLQGDIVGLIDEADDLAVEYWYDAWGRTLEITGDMASALGAYNPFRYRGYAWDEETGLYDLRARRYHPARGRFINADTLMTQYAVAGKHNLFAYCNNHPVAAKDSDGKGIVSLLVLLGAVAVGLSGCSPNENAKVNNVSIPASAYNCYAYALRKTEWEHVGDASKTVLRSVSDIEEVASVVLLDGADRGIRRLSSISDAISEDEYRIALRTGCGIFHDVVIEDYHFMRQDADGTWSHKPGQAEIRHLDEGVTPDDVSWDLFTTNGSVAIEDFYSSETIYFAIQYGPGERKDG